MPNNHTSEASRSAQSRRGRDHYNQSARASVPRPNGRHPNSVPLNNFGNHFPAAAPSNKDHFSFETVEKNQSKADTYLHVLTDSPERKYFTGLLAECMELYESACAAGAYPMHPLMQTLLNELDVVEHPKDVAETMLLQWVHCGQLEYVSNPDVRQRDPSITDVNGNAQNTPEYVPDEYYENYRNVEMTKTARRESKEETVLYTQAPRCEVRSGSGSLSSHMSSSATDYSASLASLTLHPPLCVLRGDITTRSLTSVACRTRPACSSFCGLGSTSTVRTARRTRPFSWASTSSTASEARNTCTTVTRM